MLKVDKYYEEVNGDETVFRTLSLLPNGETVPAGPWEGQSVKTPYEVTQRFEKQRAEAMASSDTLYVYDWPALFESGVERMWLDYRSTVIDQSPRRSRLRSISAVPVAMASYAGIVPHGEDVFQCKELVLCDAVTREPLKRGWTAKQAQSSSVIMLPIDREPGLNDAGMVAWLAKLRTPECPAGRELVIISNDITFQAGSFGTKEDAIFFKVYTLAYYIY